MNATALLDPDDDEYRDAESRDNPNYENLNSENANYENPSHDSETCDTQNRRPPKKPRRSTHRLTHRRTVTAVDLRRRTSEIIAALERNEELLLSHRDRWVGIMTPINLVEGFGFHPQLRRHRYFGYARRAPRLRRRIEERTPDAATRMKPDPGDKPGETPRAQGPEDDLLGIFSPPGQWLHRKDPSTARQYGADAEDGDRTEPEPDWGDREGPDPDAQDIADE